MLDDHFCGAYFQPADPESLHHLIPKWSQIFVPPPPHTQPEKATPQAYFGDAAAGAVAHLSAAPWLVWGSFFRAGPNQSCGRAVHERSSVSCRPAAISVAPPPLLQHSSLLCGSQQLAAPALPPSPSDSPPPPPPFLRSRHQPLSLGIDQRAGESQI